MASIKDISEKCGVSPATVSKALNGYGDISEATKQKVLAAAKELHYRPNAAARLLKTNSSHNIGFVYVVDNLGGGLAHDYFSSVLGSAKEEAEKNGYDITFISSTIGYGSYVDHCRYRNFDGVLVVTDNFDSGRVLELIRSDIPTVIIDHLFDGHSSIMSKNTEGAYLLTKYLIDNGHTKIAFITGERTSVTRRRLQGFYQALGEADIEIPDEYVIEAGYHDTKGCEEATAQLLALSDRPTAIMYPDDYSYLGGMRELERRHIRIPDDISVTGFDGIQLSQVLRPRLTTYRQDAEKIGQVSIDKLIETIEHKKTCVPETIQIPGEFLAGESVRDIR